MTSRSLAYVSWRLALGGWVAPDKCVPTLMSHCRIMHWHFIFLKSLLNTKTRNSRFQNVQITMLSRILSSVVISRVFFTIGNNLNKIHNIFFFLTTYSFKIPSKVTCSTSIIIFKWILYEQKTIYHQITYYIYARIQFSSLASYSHRYWHSIIW